MKKSRFLLYQLKLSMAKAKQIDIIVSFLMESGVRMILKDLNRMQESTPITVKTKWAGTEFKKLSFFFICISPLPL